MKLVKFVCTAKAHATGHSDAALTIHDGVWAFCPAGANQNGHEWVPSDGLPIADAMRFTPRTQAPATTPNGMIPGPSPVPATAKGRVRTT
jgi:hypothetical protein